VAAISNGEDGTASKAAGTILAYVANSGLFSRVIEGSENGFALEAYIGTLSNGPYPQERFESLFGQYISYDGSLEMISPYDAVMKIGQATYMGKKDGSCSAQWMEKNYNLNSADFLACVGRDLNNLINAEADVLHTLYKAANGDTYTVYSTNWANYVPATQTNTQLPPPPQVTPAGNITPPSNVTKPPAQTGGDSGNGSASEAIPKPAGKGETQDFGIMYLIAVIVILAIVASIVIKMLKKASLKRDLTKKLSKTFEEKESEKKQIKGLFSGDKDKSSKKKEQKSKPKATPAPQVATAVPEENPVKALAAEAPVKEQEPQQGAKDSA